MNRRPINKEWGFGYGISANIYSVQNDAKDNILLKKNTFDVKDEAPFIFLSSGIFFSTNNTRTLALVDSNETVTLSHFYREYFLDENPGAAIIALLELP